MTDAIISRIKRTSQPQAPVGIDWGNPLLLDAESITLGSSVFFNPTKVIKTYVGQLPGVPTSTGLGLTASNSSYQSYPLTPSNGGTNAWTVAGIFIPTTLGSGGGAIVGVAAAPNSGTFDRTLRYGAGNAWEAYVFDGGAKTATSSISASVGRADRIIYSASASTLTISVNGVETSTAVANAGFTGYGSAGFYIGNANSTSGGVCLIPLIVRVKREWNRDQRASFLNNPWQIFAPLSRTIWAPSAGGNTYTLTADSASYALTGQTTGLAFNRVLTADTQSYALTGQAATLAFNRAMVAASAAYTLTGQDAGLAFNRVLTADTVSYTLTGQNVTLTYTPIGGPTYTLTADTQSYALTGQDVGLRFNRVLTADTQSYSLSGQTAGLYFNRTLAANTVSYALTGQDVTLTYTSNGFTYTLSAESGSYEVTGQDAALTYSGGAVGGGVRDKQRKKVLKDIKRLNELILKRDAEPDAEVIAASKPKPKAPTTAKFDTSLISAKAKQQVIDDEEEELMLLMY